MFDEQSLDAIRHQPMEPASTWAEAFAAMWRKLLADIGVAVGHYDTSDEDELLCLLDAHVEVFERPVAACLLSDV